jgi:hypothetical protein
VCQHTWVVEHPICAVIPRPKVGVWKGWFWSIEIPDHSIPSN